MMTDQYKVKEIFSLCRLGKQGITGAGRNEAPLEVNVPGSKSVTNRALLLATLAEGKSILRGVLFSDDSRHFLKCVQELGFDTDVDEEHKIVEVTGRGGAVPKEEATLSVGSAGTAARFLSAYLGVSHGVYHMKASEQMCRRPMAPLLESLRRLGCQVECQGKEGFFPFTLKGNGFGTNHIRINIESSSQFLSALLISACLCQSDVEIQVEGSHGMAYIHMTEQMMEQFGVKAECIVEAEGGICYLVKKGQRYQSRDYQIEPDVSAACYFYAMAPLLGISVRVSHVHFASLQGDVEFIRILEQMGCQVEETETGIMVTGNPGGKYHGVEADMSACSDQAITLAAIAPFADSPTTITGIGHIRLQESDRLTGIVKELTKMGIACEEGSDFVKIYPGLPRPSQVETYDDHRMAMGFALTGLRADGIVIQNPNCCRKTFETYFEVLEQAMKDMNLFTETEL